MSISDNLRRIDQRIQQAAASCGRSADEITLVVVSKTQSLDRVRSAYNAGAGHIGENYIQEAREKLDTLSQLPINWHFIGHLQSNKAKYAVRMFDLIHTVDSEKLAIELNRQAEKIGKHQKVLIQVNISGENTKSGIAPKQVRELVISADRLPNLNVRGLMTIPPYYNDPERSRPIFTALAQLREDIGKNLPDTKQFKELSMGMTGDFEVAIKEGATIVRIGSAIFGERP